MSRSATDGAAQVCLVTRNGRGAVAVVAVTGVEGVAAVDRHFRAANGRRLGVQPLGRILYGRWGGAAGEDLIVCRRTSAELEIHSHGGNQSAPQIMADLRASGCAELEWGEWLRQKGMCPLAAQAQIALAAAPSLRTATILLDQYHGALRTALSDIIADLKAARQREALDRLQRLVELAPVGLHLTQPWRVVLAGLPNVGKSSLINALVGYTRAIVFDQPGTTRDVVAVATAVEGWPVELCDTAGLSNRAEPIEEAGINQARVQLKAADHILWVLDATRVDRDAKGSLWQRARAQAQSVGTRLDSARTLIVVNKTDLVDSCLADDSQAIATSAATGTGIERTLQLLAARLVPHSPPPGAPVPFTGEQVSSLQAALAASQEAGAAKALEALLSIADFGSL